jgi:hypothetical protein
MADFFDRIMILKNTSIFSEVSYVGRVPKYVSPVPAAGIAAQPTFISKISALTRQ